jgi:predicted nucleic acid-binding protein
MPGPVLIDSNFYIDRANRGLDPFAELAKIDPEWEIATCGMVMIEVLRGVKHPKALERFAAAFAEMFFIPTINPVWDLAWRLAWEMDQSGHSIPAQDLVIAAHALYADAIILTTDKNFLLVPDLTVRDRMD